MQGIIMGSVGLWILLTRNSRNLAQKKVRKALERICGLCGKQGHISKIERFRFGYGE